MKNQNNDVESKIDINIVLFCIIFVSLGLVLTFGYLIYHEISSAKSECKDIGGVYEIKDFKHLCDDKFFYKYSDDTWDFDRVIYWNDTINKLTINQ